VVQLHQVNYILHHVVNDPSGADMVQNLICAMSFIGSLLFCFCPRFKGWLHHEPLFYSCFDQQTRDKNTDDFLYSGKSYVHCVQKKDLAVFLVSPLCTELNNFCRLLLEETRFKANKICGSAHSSCSYMRIHAPARQDSRLSHREAGT